MVDFLIFQTTPLRLRILVSPQTSYTMFLAHPNSSLPAGSEIVMKDHPQTSGVTGTPDSHFPILSNSNSPHSYSRTGYHILYGSPVSIKSKFTAEQIAAQRAEHLAIPGEAKREQIGVLLQKIPVLGRVLAHLTGMSCNLLFEFQERGCVTDIMIFSSSKVFYWVCRYDSDPVARVPKI